ncbi:MAG: spermidine/putrescine ABC transporter substrate-binding protein [Actinomycetota bacterium]|nr:spermidine/putrescine ABC transporter substrate-binding protein [Actinomycetota bacterium]MDH5313770.1 spermidine/putrescine ABC transporter substrate-binding protein [Actinomycetota bacterium]
MTAGAAGLAALAPLVAACTASGSDDLVPANDRVVHVANWPLYLDRERRPDGSFARPSLERFTEETGIGVNYREVIPDAEEFFRDIQGWLAAGEPTGWDVMVITNGLTLTKLIDLDYLEPLAFDRRPNFAQNASDLVTDPAYDPGNRYSMAWQSGITGIAYDRRQTRRPISRLADLFSADFEGRIGMFGDLVDLPNLAILAIGADPETSTPEDWKEASRLLRRQRDRGIVRAYYSQSYINALEKGDVAVSMAWSGDIFQAKASGASDLRFVVPDEGGLLWTDAMCIPKGAADPESALRFMDFVYRPDVAAMIAEWVNYVTPVPAAAEVIAGRAAAETDPDRRAALERVATSPLVFPTEDMAARVSSYRELRDDDELARWSELFGEFAAR